MALAFLLLFCSSASAEKRKKREVQPVKLTLPLYYQTDYDQPVFTWKERAITVAESGCGATCVSMVIGYLSRMVSLSRMKSCGWRAKWGFTAAMAGARCASPAAGGVWH